MSDPDPIQKKRDLLRELRARKPQPIPDRVWGAGADPRPDEAPPRQVPEPPPPRPAGRRGGRRAERLIELVERRGKGCDDLKRLLAERSPPARREVAGSPVTAAPRVTYEQLLTPPPFDFTPPADLSPEQARARRAELRYQEAWVRAALAHTEKELEALSGPGATA